MEQSGERKIIKQNKEGTHYASTPPLCNGTDHELSLQERNEKQNFYFPVCFLALYFFSLQKHANAMAMEIN